MSLKRALYIWVAALISALLLVSCNTSYESIFQQFATTQQPQAEVLFRVKVPGALPPGSTLMLEVLDDVTGLYFNSTRYEMAADNGLSYSIRVPLPVSADIKYRYILVAAGSSYEFNSNNEQVRYRIARINGPEIIDDLISAWVDAPYSGPVGRITGQVIDANNNAPIPNLLVAAGGIQTFTTSDGSFLLLGLAPGLHNLVIYSMDGAYETFQQGAVIAENANTPVQVILTPRRTTRVKFEVSIPLGIDKSLPLRFVSNLFPLGNAYADLSAGSAGSAVNFPLMEKTGLNRYSIVLDLPVGFHLRYKYSLGDGFWNAELTRDSKFVIRDLVVTENLQVKDRVSTFKPKGSKPVHLLAMAPGDTPAQEIVYIQLNPFGWMEPLPMVRAGINLWEYTIYPPLQYFNSVEYRYCRNGLCDIAAETSDRPRSITPAGNALSLNDIITGWENLDKFTIDTTQFLALESIQPKPGFIAGVELAGGKPSTWRNSIDAGLQFAAGIGSDWVILTPTWTLQEVAGQPHLFPSPAQDLLWTELMTQNSHVMMSGQKTILYPSYNYAQLIENRLDSANDDNWTIAFTEQYERFIFHHADLAQLLGIEGLIIGAPPAQGVGSDLFNNLIPWEQLISGIRQRYSGRLIAAISLESDAMEIPDWLSQVDIIYVMFSPSLHSTEASVSEIRQEFDSVITEQVQPLFLKIGKPLIVGFAYESRNNRGDVDLVAQAKAYSAAILSVASRDWISGFISRGYNPYIELQDTSPTIYRKPASEILWFWFHYLLNKTPN